MALAHRLIEIAMRAATRVDERYKESYGRIVTWLENCAWAEARVRTEYAYALRGADADPEAVTLYSLVHQYYARLQSDLLSGGVALRRLGSDYVFSYEVARD